MLQLSWERWVILSGGNCWGEFADSSTWVLQSTYCSQLLPMQIGARSCRAWRSAAQNFVGSQGLKRQGNGTSPVITNHHHSCVRHSLSISSPSLSWNLSCMCNLSTPVNTLLSLPLTQTCCWILELSPKFAHHQSSVSTKRICDP